MKEIIIGFIIAIGIYKIIEIVFDLVNGIIKSKKWTKTKNQIIEYLKTLGKSEVIGYSDNVCEAKIIMTGYEIRQNIEKLFGYSFMAKMLDKVFDWKVENNFLIYKINI